MMTAIYKKLNALQKFIISRYKMAGLNEDIAYYALNLKGDKLVCT